MLNMTLVTLREGIEMFLIVAITTAVLRQTGRTVLLSAVAWGTGVAIIASVVLGTFLAEMAVTPFWEAILSAVAAVLVISMVIYMMRSARTLRRDVAARIDAAAMRPGGRAWWAVFGFVALMIVREGMETAFITASLFRQTETAPFVAGALLGLAAAAALAWAWAKHGHRIDLRLFFRVTSVFLVLFAVQLVVFAFHEATEANVLPIDNAYWHIATEPYGPEGEYGAMLTYALVLIPAAFLIFAGARTRLAARTG
jgi:high-affinity iron transporter